MPRLLNFSPASRGFFLAARSLKNLEPFILHKIDASEYRWGNNDATLKGSRVSCARRRMSAASREVQYGNRQEAVGSYGS
jgi:hypothetical protein